MTLLAGVALEARGAPPAAAAASVSGAVIDNVLRIVQVAPDLVQAPAADRAMHLRAQRFARAKVAEMRLYKASKVRSGRAQGDLYTALKDEIDIAREAYRNEFVAPCASMADYLHLEMLRTLAGGDAAQLGPFYPGALV